MIDNVYAYYGYRMYENGAPQTTTTCTARTWSASGQSDYIEELAAADEPFFVWASHVAPHGECDAGGSAARARRRRPLGTGTVRAA